MSSLKNRLRSQEILDRSKELLNQQKLKPEEKLELTEFLLEEGFKILGEMACKAAKVSFPEVFSERDERSVRVAVEEFLSLLAKKHPTIVVGETAK